MSSRVDLPAIVERVMAGRALEDLRDRLGLTQQEVADKLHWSQPKIANYETAQSAPRPEDLSELLDALGATAAERTLIGDHYDRSRTTAPRGRLRWRFQGDMRLVVDMEATAPMVRCHSAMLVPGLLQTEAYARHLMGAHRPCWTPEDVETFVANRLARQRVLDNDNQRFEFIIDQAVLNRMNNMPARHDQLRHLLDLGDRPNIDIRLVPDSHGYYLGQSADYWIFKYEDDPGVDLAYVEGYDVVDVLHSSKAVRKFRTLWREQSHAALSHASSRVYLAILAGASRAS